MKRPTYKAAIEFITFNDEPGDLDAESVSSMISVGLVAELFGKSTAEVATSVVALRRKVSV